MKNLLNSVASRKTILFLATILLVCLLLIIFISSKMIHAENVRLIGEPHHDLTTFQMLSSEATFFLNRNSLQQKNEMAFETILDVQAGKPLDEILVELQANGTVSDLALLRKVLIFTGTDRKILPGKYPIPGRSNILEIAFILQDANASLIDFTVLPGWRKEEIAAVLPTSGLSITPQDFLSIVNQPMTDEGLRSLGVTEYEGFFSPGLYAFRRNINTADFVKSLTNRFQSELSEEIKAGFTNHGLSISQAVVLASIIQREAMKDEEKPIIASVFINRLNIGMPLQSDPTVQYALGFNSEWGWWKSPLSLDDLQVDSTYNTYIIAGLPPAAISNPDMASLSAVAFPAETSFFYFRALCDGSKLHVFSETLEEHINNACPET
ncbi:MAG: endolytic transglycosylase MltG [Leptolinea sp.]